MSLLFRNSEPLVRNTHMLKTDTIKYVLYKATHSVKYTEHIL